MNIKLTAYISIIIATTLLGSIGILIRQVHVDAVLVTLFRIAIGFILLLILVWFKGHRLTKLPVKTTLLLMTSGILLSWIVISYTHAVNTTTLANAAFILYIAPLLAVGLSALSLHERYNIKNLLTLALSFSGLLLLLEFNFSLTQSNPTGLLWALLASICYTFYIVINRSIDPSIPVLTRSIYQFSFAIAAVLPFIDAEILSLTAEEYGWLTLIGVLQGFVATNLLIVAIKHLNSVEYGTLSYLEPLVAALLGSLLYAEHLSFIQSLGCFTIICCGVIQIRSSRQHQASQINST